ncbi:MAG TPA: hypothetical protein VGV64_01685, partial [Thermoplasmata archaeon]|nr:hypothetical protein [Thermoplasmata archaeon]
DMSIGGGFVSFVVTQLGVGVVFSHTAGTGGTGFVISSSFSCGGGSSLDYTDYEEVYTTTAPVPPYAFRFDNNSLDGSLERSWGAFAGGAPSGVGIGTSGASVTIENVPFDLAVAPSLNSEISPNLHRFSTNLSVLRLNPDGLLQISVSGTIPNATLSVSPPTGAAPFGSSLALNLTSAARPGSYGLEIVVIDGSGIYTRESVSVVVYSALNASAPLFAPTEPEVNQTVGISENPSGGSGGFRYQWSGLPVGCAGAGFSFSCSIPSSGTYPISVNVSDSLGFSSASRTVPLVVVAALRVTLLSNLSTVDVGQSLTFQATTLGGSGGARFAFSGGGTDCLGLGPNYTCVPTSPGTLSVSVTATDSNGHRVSSPPNHVQVSADPSIVVHLGRSTVDAGVPVEMSVTIMGGYGAIRTAWNGLPPSCGALANGSYDCAFPSEGAYSIRVQASDANGFSTESPVLTVQVEPRPTVTLTATPATGLSGNPVALVASVDGGSTPFRFAWSGLPEGCQGSGNATVACTPTAVGSFHVVVSVTDADGANASASVEVTTAVSFLGLPGLEGEIVVGAAVGAVALLAIGVSWRRRARRQRPGPEGSSTDPVGEAGPR